MVLPKVLPLTFGEVRQGALSLLSRQQRSYFLKKNDSAVCSSLLDSQAYRGLTDTSLALCKLTVTLETPRYINVVFADLAEKSLFAGIHTALRFAMQLAKSTGDPVRILTLGRPTRLSDAHLLQAQLRTIFGPDAPEVLSLSATLELACNPSDIWIATYWETAHALQVAVDLGVLPKGRLVYLVQDFEPDFFPASTESELCRSTYHGDLLLVVNSTPVSRIIQAREHITLEASQVFHPQIPEALPRPASASRVLRVAFYARPNKPRNMFALGIAALKLFSNQASVRELSIEFVSIGESHSEVALSEEHTLHSMGKLSWDDYFKLLQEVDVLLTLQATPHPSHPPFDIVRAGGVAVTNDLEGSRRDLHPHIIACNASPRALSEGLEQGLRIANSRDTSLVSPHEEALESLGAPMEECVHFVVSKLRPVSDHARR